MLYRIQVKKLIYKKRGLGLRGFFQFASGGKAYIYDKNIQDDLVGETITPVLELVIEADVLIDSITGLAV